MLAAGCAAAGLNRFPGEAYTCDQLRGILQVSCVCACACACARAHACVLARLRSRVIYTSQSHLLVAAMSRPHPILRCPAEAWHAKPRWRLRRRRRLPRRHRAARDPRAGLHVGPSWSLDTFQGFVCCQQTRRFRGSPLCSKLRPWQLHAQLCAFSCIGVCRTLDGNCSLASILCERFDKVHEVFGSCFHMALWPARFEY